MIGIIAAMDIEIQAILDLCKDVEKLDKFGMDMYTARLHEKELVICKSGVGKVGASIAATLLCTTFELQYLINIGTAGGLKDEQNVFDIVISNDIIQADFDTSALDGEEGVGLRFTCDKGLRELAQQVCKENDFVYHVGTIASQDLFMAKQEHFTKLMNTFEDSICSEMEAGAVAQVCQTFQIPYVIVRSLSDVACHDENPMEFMEYAALASKRSSALVSKMIEKI